MKKQKQTFKDKLNEKFSWDVTDLPAYVNEQSDEIATDVIYSSGFTSRVMVDEGVKGKKTIKTMIGDLALQAVESCVMSDDGSVTFDGVDLEVKSVGVQMSLCNQDLEGKWSEMLLAIGANRQNREMPLEDVIAAYMVKQTRKKIQDVIFKGDTTSLNPDLAHFDGLIKLWNADTAINVATGSFPITSSNAFATFLNVYNAIPAELFDNDINVEIICSRVDARAVIEDIYNTKDYSATFSVTEEAGELSFILPTTNIRVRTYPQLATGQVYAVPYRFVYVGTDLESDFDGFEIKYLEESEVLRASNKMKLGVKYIFPQYFVRLSNPAS
jgi:hypothetical protein